jgi:hypothetical protein
MIKILLLFDLALTFSSNRLPVRRGERRKQCLR